MIYLFVVYFCVSLLRVFNYHGNYLFPFPPIVFFLRVASDEFTFFFSHFHVNWTSLLPCPGPPQIPPQAEDASADAPPRVASAVARGHKRLQGTIKRLALATLLSFLPCYYNALFGSRAHDASCFSFLLIALASTRILLLIDCSFSATYRNIGKQSGHRLRELRGLSVGLTVASS